MHILLTYLISKIVVAQDNNRNVSQSRAKHSLAADIEIVAIDEREHFS